MGLTLMGDRRSGAEQGESLSSAAPTSRAERVPSLDVLRGFALLGILVLNIQDFASAGGILHDIPLEVVGMVGPHHALDSAVMTIQWLFFEGKMRALFAALFGAGTALLLDRMEQRRGDGTAADIFHRRNMWLMLFGTIHGSLIWYGDILLLYSSLALLTLYPLRHVAGRTLLLAGLALSLLGGTLGLANAMGLREAWSSAALQERARDAHLHGRPLTPAEGKAEQDAAAKRREELAALPKANAAAHVSYWESQPANAAILEAFEIQVVYSGWVIEVAGMLIAGMGLYKTGFLTGRLRAGAYLLVALLGYAITIPVVLIGLHHARLFGFSDAVTTLWMFLPYGVEQIACMLANASLVLLLVKRGWLLPVQHGLAAVGRMAFSNYILTSLLCQFLFRWGPWKLFGTLEYYQQIYVVAGVWAINIVFSLVWLRVFAFGPLEWIWRSLTYWRRQPLLVRTDPSAPARPVAMPGPVTQS
jgi:uncharacterized protein